MQVYSNFVVPVKIRLGGIPQSKGRSQAASQFGWGYVDYKSLYDIELNGSYFVTRMKSNGKYKRIRNNPHEKDGPIISDLVIQWQVELFFKWIKQNLNIKSFWGTSENAVFTQLWVALILSVLLWICRTLDGISASTHQIVQMIKTTLLSRGSILELCASVVPPPEIPSNQLLLERLL